MQRLTQPPNNPPPSLWKGEAFVDTLGCEDDVRFITILNCGASQLGHKRVG